MNNASLRLTTCIAVVVAVGSLWRVATGEPKVPARIGDRIKIDADSLKNNGTIQVPLESKLDMLASRVEKLEAENAALKKQVAQMDSQVQKNWNDLGVTKLLLSGLDTSVTKLDKDYRNHTHEMGFGFSNPATVVNSPSNILVPWISGGQLKSGSNFRTSPPVQK